MITRLSPFEILNPLVVIISIFLFRDFFYNYYPDYFLGALFLIIGIWIGSLWSIAKFKYTQNKVIQFTQTWNIFYPGKFAFGFVVIYMTLDQFINMDYIKYHYQISIDDGFFYAIPLFIGLYIGDIWHFKFVKWKQFFNVTKIEGWDKAKLDYVISNRLSIFFISSAIFILFSLGMLLGSICGLGLFLQGVVIGSKFDVPWYLDIFVCLAVVIISLIGTFILLTPLMFIEHAKKSTKQNYIFNLIKKADNFYKFSNEISQVMSKNEYRLKFLKDI
ncbi:hypothetical protein FIT92_04185 [Candidatus Methylopumilus universalis]|uniref:Uncharacterized protein n=1 Tax=Candidatus Methylopumilus universalis TaxID=2588536 RepID=A0AAX1EZS4_9PROT|nr:hypothetical protein [Candidatus Methylopumilus universalis]QDC41260.1 hypothetical protein FIT94_04185 [Candidatus Methylopumilus universalis]QDC57499.1 hypothetical protein FIT96_04185 [Candidatus Methylopumilus universalis]QDC58789.1 hypothetical protein FIT92_04185 [Candidatus Methylopumilus universalis]QDC60076.1 hypothetical protein FIT93_04185 [Candidatus Methylopumilus universalis]QDC66884.1 hypothetical protein FIT89_04215 [Candidatus Methylopumilus universalis]